MPREEFSKLAPPALPVSPDWSPINGYGGYAKGNAKLLVRPTPSPAHIVRLRTWPGKIAPPGAGRLGALGLGLRLLCILIRAVRKAKMKVLFLSFLVGLGVGALYGSSESRARAAHRSVTRSVRNGAWRTVGIWIQTRKLDVPRAAADCLVRRALRSCRGSDSAPGSPKRTWAERSGETLQRLKLCPFQNCRVPHYP